MEHINAASADEKPNSRPKKAKEVRDPYDGLRPWSAITHGVGAVLALIGTAVLLARSVLLGASVWHIVSFAIYGASMICLYTASTLYHCVNTTVAGRLNLRRYDHCSIFLLIAGSYTPICLVVLRTSAAWGWVLFGLVWGMAVLGILQSILWIGAPRGLTAAVYIVMGWMAVVAMVPLVKVFPFKGMALLIGGGLLYTVGGVLYALKWPGRNNPRFGCHEIFHVFILLGSFVHFLMMYQVIAVY